MKMWVTRYTKIFMAVLIPAAIMLAWQGTVYGDVTLGSYDWDNPADGVDGWSSMQGNTALQRQETDGDGWLGIEFAQSTEPEDSEDIVYVSADNLFAGQWSTNMWVEFDFWSSNTVAESLQVRWATNSLADQWSYSVDASASSNNWTTYTASFRDWNDWAGFAGATEARYLEDLANIDWLGIYIERGSTAQENYGLDDHKLMVPEPGEWLMLAVSCIVSVWGIKKRNRVTAASGQ
jgi:hypothetical protein